MVQVREIVVNMGPQHPSTHGVFRIKLWLDGEVVVKSEPIIGYLHRGVEKLAEKRTYAQFTPITDRLDYIAAISNELGWVEAVEKLMGIEVPPKAEYIRVILTELTRIASHLVWLGTHALDIGVMSLILYCFREREHILDIFEMVTGARLTCHAFRIGGLPQDVPDGFLKSVKEFVEIFPKYLNDYHKLLTDNRIWLRRTKNVGIISAEDAIDLGLSGPSIRGSGVKFDLRKANPYSVYNKFEFEIPTGKNGDVYDRYKVRIEEMKQSVKILRQAIDGIPEGPISSQMPVKVAGAVKTPPGEIYTAVESPRGENGVYLVSDGKPTAYRLKLRTPSFYNLSAVPYLLKGALIADVVAILGSLDPVFGDVDR